MHGDVSNLGGLLIGDGDMAELIFEQVSATGMKRWTMVHPQERRAKAWAERNLAHWRPFGELPQALAASDLVVSALDVGAELVSADMVKAALKVRKRRPILLIDSGVPGDMDARIGDLDDAFRIRWTTWNAWRWRAGSVAPARRKMPGASSTSRLCPFAGN
jgi:glutamyl-tRNA reductase